MKNFNFVFPIFLFFIFLQNTFAQKEPFKLGDVTEEEVKMTSYDKDKTAPAVILSEFGSYEHDSDTKTDIIVGRLKVKVKKKIFSALHYATVILQIPSKGRIEDIEAYSYNWENGKIQKNKMEKSAIFEKKQNEHWNEVKFIIPNVKVGSVIEYAYTKISPYILDVPTWYFQAEIPTVYSEYRVGLCGITNFSINSQMEQPFYIQESKKTSSGLRVHNTKDELVEGTAKYRWVQKDVPAFKREQFMTCAQDYLTKVYFYPSEVVYANQSLNFTFMLSWEQLIERLLQDKDFGGFINTNENIKPIVQALLKDKKTSKEKMITIFEYVKNNFEVENIFEEKYNSIFATKNLNEVLQTKKGFASEINLLLIAMLKEAKIDVNPLITSTRDHGAVYSDLKITKQFNAVLAYVQFTETENYILDATDKNYAIDVVDNEALNNKALLVKNFGHFKWFELQKRKSTKSTALAMDNLILSENGTFERKSNVKFTGYSALEMRKQTQKALKNGSFGKTFFYVFPDLDKVEQTLEGTCNLILPEKAQLNGDFMYISPLMDYAFKENPFKQENRKLQIDFNYPFETSQYITLEIPQNYKIEELPKTFKTRAQDESIKFDFAIQKIAENKIQIVNKLQINRAVFAPEEYKMLKDFYIKIIEKHQEQIVLKKK